MSVHIVPVDPATATARLRRRLARLESGLRSDADHGRLRDPQAEAATEDAYALADRVARGEGRLFTVGLSITVRAGSEPALAARVEEIRALAAGLLIDVRPTTYRALQGWITGLPVGLDRLAQSLRNRSRPRRRPARRPVLKRRVPLARSQDHLHGEGPSR